jgi:CO/xanthine dehydrogenase FAD-binding subunit
VYAAPFSYYRAASAQEAVKLLQELGEGARVIAGGQSLIPLMKMRMARPAALIDINHISSLGEIQTSKGELRFGALVRHADLEHSAAGATVPILHDCAAGIADAQVRNQGTIGGSFYQGCLHDGAGARRNPNGGRGEGAAQRQRRGASGIQAQRSGLSDGQRVGAAGARRS